MFRFLGKLVEDRVDLDHFTGTVQLTDPSHFPYLLTWLSDIGAFNPSGQRPDLEGQPPIIFDADPATVSVTILHNSQTGLKIGDPHNPSSGSLAFTPAILASTYGGNPHLKERLFFDQWIRSLFDSEAVTLRHGAVESINVDIAFPKGFHQAASFTSETGFDGPAIKFADIDPEFWDAVYKSNLKIRFSKGTSPDTPSRTIHP